MYDKIWKNSTKSIANQQKQIKFSERQIKNDFCLSVVSQREKLWHKQTLFDVHPKGPVRTPAAKPLALGCAWRPYWFQMLFESWATAALIHCPVCYSPVHRHTRHSILNHVQCARALQTMDQTVCWHSWNPPSLSLTYVYFSMQVIYVSSPTPAPASFLPFE